MLTELALSLGTTSWASFATTAAALYRRRLHTDPLTELGNRAALYTRARRVRRGLVGLVMVDLDPFKAINDTHGHDFGNKVLATVASRLTESTQAGEHAVRLHGDEFAVWLRPTAPATAEARAAEISAAMAGPLVIEGLAVTVTGSVGAAVAPADHPLPDLLAAADAAMYAAKKDGRTLEGVGIKPRLIEAIIPSYLMRFRVQGQFTKPQTGPDLDRAER